VAGCFLEEDLDPSDLQRAPACPVTPDRPKVSLEIMNIDGMTLCEREARGERAQSRLICADEDLFAIASYAEQNRLIWHVTFRRRA
jgi:hypothetical protein